MLASNCAWTNAVNAKVVTISSATWTAKPERFMNPPWEQEVLVIKYRFSI
jgi:hypothetical protein